MRKIYHLPGRLAALLLCLLFQQCTRDLPTPAPAPRPATSANRFAEAIARGDVHAQREKVQRSEPTKSSETDNQESVISEATTSLFAPSVCFNYYMVYYDNTGTVVGRDFLYSDCQDASGGGGGDGGGFGGGGGGGYGGGGGGGGTSPDVNELSPNMILVDRPDIPVTNIKHYLKCFDTNQPATLTVYARQPVPGTNNTYTFNGMQPDVGHSFISVTQNGITRVFGFYPSSPASFKVDAPGMWGDNSQPSYTGSASMQINGGNLWSLLHYVYSLEGQDYRLATFNCTDFAISAAHAAGVDLPDTWGRWGGIGGGSNPGDFGNDLNTKPLPSGVQRGGTGSSPTNKGGC